MIKFDGKIVQFGFGAIGKSFYEKLDKEVNYIKSKYYVITMEKTEFQDYINLGGFTQNFILVEVNRDNYKEIFGNYLEEGDLLIDFADTVGTRDICDWCAQNNIMYINTGETDWADNWYSIFNENTLKCEIREKHKLNPNTNKYPIILQHGNNPGLVSHFVKAGLEYIIKKQFNNDKVLKNLLKQNKFNEIAKYLELKMIHVNDIDLQKVSEKNFEPNKLYSTWSIDSFFFEMLSESTINLGTHEKNDFEDECRFIDYDNGYVELKSIAVDTKCKTYYPNGKFEGFLVPHEETITIAKSLEVIEEEKVVYRPTVMFVYCPCDISKEYFIHSRVNNYPNSDPLKPQDGKAENGEIIRGFLYPKKWEILYKERITDGTEYVGVLLMGEKFKPVWIGNRIEAPFLYKDKKRSYWQTATITPVAMSALSAVCWMIKNKDKGGIYFPDDIDDYKSIIKLAEKYISKTIYKTFEKDEITDNLNIENNDLLAKDFFVK